MIKLLLTLIMVFTFGTSTVNAEENTTNNIENRIDELAETKPDSKSAIKAKVAELSEDELKAIIANVDDLVEPTEEDLAIKEAAMNKLEEMEDGKELSPLTIGLGELSPLIIGLAVLGVGFMFSTFIMVFKGSQGGTTLSFVAGMLLIGVATLLLIKW